MGNQLDLFDRLSGEVIPFPLCRRKDAVREIALALSARKDGRRRWYKNHIASGFRLELHHLGVRGVEAEIQILKLQIAVDNEIQRLAVKEYLYGDGE